MLAKLRDEYQDPLLVRCKNKMELTSFARSLKEPVKLLIRQAEELKNLRTNFDPFTTDHVFRIGLEDAIQTAVSASLYNRVAEEAPNARLHISRDCSIEDSAGGKVDLILSHHQFRPPMYSELVYYTPFLSVSRAGHPILNRDMSLDKFVQCEHAAIYYEFHALDSVEDEIDRKLEALNLQREKKIIISSYVSAKKIVASTDLIAAIPAAFAARYESGIELNVFKPPIDLDPVPVYCVWHERNNLHPAHIWFRETVKNVMQVELEEIAEN